MSGSALLAYAVALMIAIASPGPAVLAILSKSITKGSKPAVAMALGIAVGDVLLGSLAMLGLVVILALFGWLMTVIKFCAAAYLIFLGIRMWRSSPRLATDTSAARADLVAGLVVALSNPKAILFHASLMPLIIDLEKLTFAGAFAIWAIIFAITMAVMGGYALLGGHVRQWIRTPSRLSWMNRAAGAAMVGTGFAVAAR